MSNLSTLASAPSIDLLLAEIRGEVKVTRLPARKAKRSELVMSMTKGSRTNTNRRGQAYNGHASREMMVEANQGSYFKTSG